MIRKALSASEVCIDVFQVSFTRTEIPLFDLDFTKGIQEALQKNHQKGNVNFKVRILLSADWWALKPQNDFQVYHFRKWLEKKGLSDYVEIKYCTYKDFSHAKTVCIDKQFLIVGSQNWDYSAFGTGGTLDLAEYNLGVDSKVAADDYLDYFNNFWENHSEPYKVNDESVDPQAVVANAQDGDVVTFVGDSYQISEPIEINKQISIISMGSVFEPAALHKASAGSSPLFRIQSPNVTLSGLVLKNTYGFAVEISQDSERLQNIQIQNCLFEKTTGGINISASSLPVHFKIENNTFVNGENAVYLDSANPATLLSLIRNNIFYGQTCPVKIVSENDRGVEYGYNLFFDCNGSCLSNWHDGNFDLTSSIHDNLFDVDPLFVYPDTGNYNLQRGSPAIDSGDTLVYNNRTFDGDGDGFPRIDIGAFEYFPDSLFVGRKQYSHDSRPNDFVLSQNYPNPFNNSTTIRFTIPCECKVQLNIYNIKGQVVATLLNTWKNAGSHRFTFDSKGLPLKFNPAQKY